MHRQVALVVALAACAPEGDTPSGVLVEFTFEDTSRGLCAGSVMRLNRYVERVFDFLREPVPEDFTASVRVLAAPPCGGNKGACYSSTSETVFIKVLDEAPGRPGGVLRHELSHAVIDRVWGSSVPFFAEGLAESLSRTDDWSSATVEVDAVGDMLGEEAEHVDYFAAARFVRFLIDTRGIERFKRLFQSTQARTAIRAKFMEVYGEDFAALEAEYLSGAPRCLFQLDICDEQGAERVGPGWSLALAASCADPDFYGSIGQRDEVIATQRTIFVEVAGPYRVRSSSRVVLARCGGCDEQAIPTTIYANATVALEVGFYTLEFTQEQDAVVELELSDAEDGSIPP